MRAAAMLGMVALAPSIAVTLDRRAAEPSPLLDLDYGGGSRRQPSRGKHKLRRHGQKLKSCRVKIGRRVRRKHRRAA